MSSLYQDHEGQHRDVATGVSISHEDRAFAESQAAVQRQLAWQSRIRTAREKVCALAMQLAQDGLPADLVAESMLSMAAQASQKAAEYIADFDAREARELADDIADMQDDYAYGADEEVDS